MRGGSSSFCPFARPWETTCSYPTPALADSTLQAAALRALRNRTVLFYGDSLDGQMFVAVACMLRHHAGHADFHAQWWPNGTDGVVKKRCSDADHCHYSEACVTFAPQQARLCMCLKGLTSCSQKLKNLRPAFRPSIDLLLEGTRALPVWSSTALAWDAHIDAGDCTHYCQPGIPGIWAGLLIQAVARQSRPLS